MPTGLDPTATGLLLAQAGAGDPRGASAIPGVAAQHNAVWVAEFRRNLSNFDGDNVLVRPANLYPPYSSPAELINASLWSRYDRTANRYGETNVTDARNIANERVEAIVAQLARQLEQLFGNGRFGGQNRDWLRRGLEAAGNLGVAGAAGGPYTAVATAIGGFLMSAVQDLWPGRKQELLDGWRGLCRELTPIERYLLWSYMREVAKACFRAEPGWTDPQQRASDPWRWGTQPQPFGHNIVTAGPLGILTLLVQINFEFDSFPMPERVAPTASYLDSLRRRIASATNADIRLKLNGLLQIASAPNAMIEDPSYIAYVAAVLCADHPDDWYLRDCRHRADIYGRPDPRGAAWIRTDLWPNIRNRKVGELKSDAIAYGLVGMTPTLYTSAIDRILVETELPHRR